jgi:hypothetical protein
LVSKKHNTGKIRTRKNAYGNKKVSAITGRGKIKAHTVYATSTSFSGRKGLTGKSAGYARKSYVGRKTGCKA